MKYWLLIVGKLPANAMALFPFILLKSTAQKNDLILINHEKIHLQQQLELLIIPFYFLYVVNYCFNLLKYKNHYQAYFNISFEREAYQNEHDLSYIAGRKCYNWINFIKQ